MIISKKSIIITILVVLICTAVFSLFYYNKYHKSTENSFSLYEESFYDIEQKAMELYISAQDTTREFNRRLNDLEQGAELWVSAVNYWYDVELNGNLDDQDLIRLQKTIEYCQLRTKELDAYSEMLQDGGDPLSNHYLKWKEIENELGFLLLELKTYDEEQF